MESPRRTGAIRDLCDDDSSRRHDTKPELTPQYRAVCAAFRVFSKNTLRRGGLRHG